MLLDSLLDLLKKQYTNKLPFVVYKKPNTTEIKAILQHDNLKYVSQNFKDVGFLFSPFNTDADSIIMPLSKSKIHAVQATQVIEEDTVAMIPHDALSTNLKQKEDHINLVKEGINAINDNKFEKVVLSRKEVCKFKNDDLFISFINLVKSYPLSFVYLWYHPKVGLWLGATPETLLKIEGNQFSIMSLAGTQEYNGTLNVIWQQKELQEQQFVTDFILDHIKNDVDKITLSDVETVKSGNLLHLRTVIKGLFKTTNPDFEKLIYNLHPTPAVCGLPKIAARDFINKHEHYNREFYTGFLGELNFETQVKPRTGHRNIENRAYTIKRKSTQLYVNLRCMQIKGDKALVYVGGGITKTSNPESEWEETVAKSKVIKKVL